MVPRSSTGSKGVVKGKSTVKKYTSGKKVASAQSSKAKQKKLVPFARDWPVQKRKDESSRSLEIGATLTSASGSDIHLQKQSNRKHPRLLLLPGLLNLKTTTVAPAAASTTDLPTAVPSTEDCADHKHAPTAPRAQARVLGTVTNLASSSEEVVLTMGGVQFRGQTIHAKTKFLILKVTKPPARSAGKGNAKPRVICKAICNDITVFGTGTAVGAVKPFTEGNQEKSSWSHYGTSVRCINGNLGKKPVPQKIQAKAAAVVTQLEDDNNNSSSSCCSINGDTEKAISLLVDDNSDEAFVVSKPSKDITERRLSTRRQSTTKPVKYTADSSGCDDSNSSSNEDETASSKHRTAPAKKNASVVRKKSSITVLSLDSSDVDETKNVSTRKKSPALKAKTLSTKKQLSGKRMSGENDSSLNSDDESIANPTSAVRTSSRKSRRSSRSNVAQEIHLESDDDDIESKTSESENEYVPSTTTKRRSTTSVKNKKAAPPSDDAIPDALARSRKLRAAAMARSPNGTKTTIDDDSSIDEPKPVSKTNETPEKSVSMNSPSTPPSRGKRNTASPNSPFRRRRQLGSTPEKKPFVIKKKKTSDVINLLDDSEFDF